MKKEILIKAIIYDDLMNIRTGHMDNWLEDILKVGFVGYENRSISELQKEYQERELENQLSNNF